MMLEPQQVKLWVELGQPAMGEKIENFQNRFFDYNITFLSEFWPDKLESVEKTALFSTFGFARAKILILALFTINRPYRPQGSKILQFSRRIRVYQAKIYLEKLYYGQKIDFENFRFFHP
jgi:hypothetical protein